MPLSPPGVIKSLPTPTWGGAPPTYRAHHRKIVAVLIKKGLAALLLHEEIGLEVLTADTTPKKANANIKVFATLPESTSGTTFQVIEAETEDLGYGASGPVRVETVLYRSCGCSPCPGDSGLLCRVLYRSCGCPPCPGDSELLCRVTREGPRTGRPSPRHRRA